MKPKTVNIYEAKTHFSRLIREVATGTEVIIAKDGRPVARLVPILPPATRTLGAGRGRIRIARDFDTPLPADIASAFEPEAD